ncbi:MAG TPA: PKD domain-containing protein, partial [Flavisolibacter sp.]|nr:PKD domain-containing protein [Flavisolibacter sp.]
FGDGTSADQPSASHTYSTPGKYSVSLIVSSSSGCRDTLRKQDLLSIQDVATRFTAPDSICIFSPASFTNASTPVPNSSQWTFGDGTSASTIDATKAFSSAGTYTVKLSNDYGYCADTFSKVIQALPRPKAALTSSSPLQCKPPLTVAFSDASTNAVGWFWDFGDGQTSTAQNPSHAYNQYGDYTVMLVVTNRSGCTDTLRKEAYVQIQKPVITFPSLPQNGCVPYDARFSAAVKTLDNVTSYLWDFGDGNTSTAAAPAHTYPDQGNYTVSLIITTSTGCTDSLVLDKAIVVGRKPVIDFTATPNPVCAFQDVFFTGTANEGDTWVWDFGDGTGSTAQNPVHMYKDTGRFTVTMAVVNNGCRVSLAKPSFIGVKPPIAKFNVLKTCGKDKEFSFKDISIGAKTWSWDFGDGTKTSTQNPSHIYKDYGAYNVSLTVTNDTCSHTSIVPVYVFAVSPDFSADKTEACKVAVIAYTSVVNDPGRIASYNWDFSNGLSSVEPHPRVTYEKAGTFSTTLITTDIYNCKDTVFKKNYIRINGPIAGFTASNNIGCKGLTALFTDRSTNDGLHPIVSWDWSYGDGNSDSFQSPTTFKHTYNVNGSFPVQLTVTDKAGCKDSLLIADAVVTTAPSVDFTSKDTLTCLGSTVNFSSITNAASYVTSWDFGDGTTDVNPNPRHVYTDTGAYTVRFRLTDSFGCADSIAKTAYINIKKTTASFDVSDSIGGCVPYEVRFTNTSNFYNRSQWNFGGSSSTVTNPVSTYTVPGQYTVRLVVTGQGGCVDSARKNIVVYNDSVHKFSYTPFDACKPLLLHTNISSPANMTYSWDFGDGTLVTTKSKDTTHLYQMYGSFLPRLIISDSGNCLLPYFSTDTVFVRGSVPKFGWDKKLLCDSGTVTFIDSTTSNERITQYNWTFGDGNSSTQQNPVHFYQQPGNYSVTLIAKTSAACSDTLTLNNLVKVVQSPAVGILGDTVLCMNGSLRHEGLFLRQDTSAVNWFWQFPNGASPIGMNPPVQSYTTPGDFAIQLVAINSSGCTDTATKNLHVNPLPVITVQPSFTTLVGVPVTLQPVGYSSNVVSYSWTPVLGLSCSDCPQPVASPKFNTVYTVLATDSNGCWNTASTEVILLCKGANVFVPNTFSPNGDGSNDVFYVRGFGLARVKSLRIYNRLGEMVFQRQDFVVNNPANGWDGTYKGSKLSPDTFVYQLDVFCENSESVRIDGSITLLR